MSDLGNHDNKVDPFALAKLFSDPRNARFLSIYMRECGEVIDALTNVAQFHADGKEFALARCFGLTDGNETLLFSCRIRWIAPSGTNEGGDGRDVGGKVKMREILLTLSTRAGSMQEKHR